MVRYFKYVLLQHQCIKASNKRSIFTLKHGLNVTSDQVNMPALSLYFYSVLLTQVWALNGLNILLQHENRGKCVEWERRLFCA